MGSPVWTEARKRAKAETLDLIRLNNLPRALLTVGTPVVGFVATLGLTGQLAIAGIATLIWTGLCGLLIYLGKLIGAPAKIAAEKQAELEALRAANRIPKFAISLSATVDSKFLEDGQVVGSLQIKNNTQLALCVEGASVAITIDENPSVLRPGNGFIIHSNEERAYNYEFGSAPAEKRDGTIIFVVRLVYSLPDEPPARAIDQTLAVEYHYRGAITESRCTTVHLAETDLGGG